MHIWVNRQWDYINGILLDNEQTAGTVKAIAGYDMSDEDMKKSDWVIVKQPKLWLSNTGQKEKKEKIACIDTVQLPNDATGKSNTANVQYMKKQGCEQSRQFVSSKRMQKLLKRGEPMYLALVRPTNGSKQGMTQKVKFQMMKEKGAVRKAPPIAETRRHMCNEAPGEIRQELQGLLEEYADLFPEQLPKGKPPKRTVEFEIKMEEGSTPPN